MKKFVLPAIGILASLLTAQAQEFFPTNLVVERLGNGSQGLVTSGNTINLDQYTTTGTLVSTVTAPTTYAAGGLICGGTSATEGYVSLSENGRYLVFAGYNTNLGSVSVSLSSTGATTNSRGVATVDAYGNYTLQFSGNVETGNSIRGATSDGSNNFWIDGGVTGIIYVGNNGSQATVSTSTPNERCLNIFNNNLYYSTSSGVGPGIGFWEVPGLATTTGGNNVNAAGGQLGYSSSEDFVVNTSKGIAYLCDDDDAPAGGVIRYTNTGSAWVSNYTLATGTKGAYAIAVDWSKANPVLYVTVGDTSIGQGNTLATITDTGASSSAITIATAPSGCTFRGLCWAPGVASPAIASQTGSQLTDNGQNVTFSVSALGSPILTYQWYSNNNVTSPTFSPISLATNAALTLSDVTPGQSNTTYYVVVDNGYGSVQSTNAVLTVDPPGPPIQVDVTPGSQTVNAGVEAIFNGTFVGSQSSLSYGWTHNGSPVQNGADGGSTIYGATTPTLTVSNAFAIDDGSYVFYVTNNFGGSNSAAASLAVNDPAIVTNVMGATNFPGHGPVTLSVRAVGTGLSYQWYSNSVLLTGSIGSNYTAANQSSPNSTSYTVVVTSTDGTSVTNGPAVVAFSYLLIQENFDYPNGSTLFATAESPAAPGSPWTVINTTEGAPEIVYTNLLQVSPTNATTDSQDLFNTNVLDEISGLDGVYWVSFTINVSALPSNPGGVYIANLEDVNYNFYGRVFCLTSNNVNVSSSYGNFPANVPTVAFPGTYRVGISDSQGDYATNATSGPTAIVPLDLIPGITYTVVYALDYDNLYSRIAVNPSSVDDVLSVYPITGLASGAADDAFADTTSPPLGYGFRQRGGEATAYIGSLKVAGESDDGNYDGYGYVTAGTTASLPVIGLQPVGTSNYLGNAFTMEVAASGIGAPGVGLTYAWYKNTLGSPGTYTQLQDTGDVSGSALQALNFSAFAAGDAGTYYVKVTGTAGTTQSASTVIALNTTGTPPSFTAPGAVNPSGTPTVSEGNTVTLTGIAVGTGPITYDWYLNTGSGYSLVSGPSSSGTYSFAAEPALSGSYEVVATGGTAPAATSSVTVLTVTGPTVETIGYLRTLQGGLSDGPNGPYTVDGTPLYTITGTITTFTNFTSGNTSSYYLQDSTGGINFFESGDSTFRPAMGDVVTVTGTLSEYYNNLELDVNVGTQYEVYSDLTATDPGSYPAQPVPAGQLLPWGEWVTDAPYVSEYIVGSVVTLTNVYFTSNYVSAGVVFTNSHDFWDVTNNTGETFDVYVSEQQTNFDGAEVPPFAYSVSGVLVENESPDPLYYVCVSRYSDIVTTPPPQIGVFNGPTAIANGQATAINFGSALQGAAAPSLTFTVTNTGGSTLDLGPISVPAEYGVTTGPPTTLAPGASGTFTVHLNTATVGTFTGNIVLTNNDFNNYPFTFPVTGTIVSSSAPITGFHGAVSGDGTHFLLSWSAVANSSSYSVKYSTNVTGPYTALATGLTFGTTNGTFSAGLPGAPATFYLITSP